MPVSGILPVNKSVGLRSTDCVQKIRRTLGRGAKVGHGGTLDSTASGLLVILIGQATRLSNFIMSMTKRYETTVAFGERTSTDDAEGEVLERAPWRHITNDAIDSALCGFMGWCMQSPPAVSAVHVNGTRAHVLARGGLKFQPDAKPVFFSDITRTSDLDEDGRVSFSVLCRRGTYIRSFARDLGERLGSAAHVASLKRCACGSFIAERAKTDAELFQMKKDELTREIIPIQSLELPCASYAADSEAFAALSCGRSVALSSLARISFGAEPCCGSPAVVKSDGLFSICRISPSGGTLALLPETNIFLPGGFE